jgi:WD40 repeat protein
MFLIQKLLPKTQWKKDLIDKMLLERISLAGIARVVDVSESWLHLYVNKKSYAVPRTIQIPEISEDSKLIIQCYEVWSFINNKGNKYWIWLAIDINTKKIVGLYIGSRDKRLWRVSNGELIAKLQGHTDKVYSVAISPQDGTIASGSKDYTIPLWDDKTGQFIKTLANQGTIVGSLSFNPDGSYLVSGVGEGEVCHVWSYPSGKEIVTYKQHDNAVIATAISPDGRWVATGGGNDRAIHIWNLRDGTLKPKVSEAKQRLRGVGASI